MQKRFVLLGMLLAQPAFALDPDKCFVTRTQQAMLRHYDYKYLGPGFITSRTSGQEGSSKTSSARMTQSSTMSLDPGVTTTGDSASTTQWSSSYGNCNFYGMNGRQIERERFIAANLPELKRDIARGRGERLTTLAFYSDCDPAVASAFARALRARYASLQDVNNERDLFSAHVDTIVRQEPTLSGKCLQHS